MESLAYLHVALAYEAEVEPSSDLNCDLSKLIRKTQSGVLSSLVLMGIVGMAESALAQSQRLLKRGMTGADVTEVQSRLKTLGYFNQNIKVTRYFGSITQQAVFKFQQAKGLQADGIVGSNTWSALFNGAESSELTRENSTTSKSSSPFNTNSFTDTSSSSPFNTTSFIEPLPLAGEFPQDLSLQQSPNVRESFPRGLVLKRGSRGNYVRQLQELLQSQGFNTAGIDGVYGSRTIAAVRRFQQEKGLTPDGIAGSRTLTTLSQ